MSEEKVEIVRAAIDAYNRRDWDDALKATAPDFKLDNSRDLNEWRGIYTTSEDVKRMWAGFLEPWESLRYEVDEVTTAGAHVITQQTGIFRGRAGIEVKARTVWVWTFRDEQVTELVTYPTLDEALEAAGLSE